MPESLCVAVCACTYKRPEGLRRLLDGLAAQTFKTSQGRKVPCVHVVIADNEGSAEVRDICETFEPRRGISLTYIHEPQRGIPYARNACLDHLPPNCDFFAFIDDDEVPKGDWLEHLLLAQEKTGADVVAGKVVPLFAEGTPSWISSGGFFGSPRRWCDLDLPKREDLQVLDHAATNNVLVCVGAARQSGVRFDTTFAFTGGSDALFFRTLHHAGCRIVFADRAIVYDYVPISRTTLRYMCRERFRVANNNVLIDALIEGRPRPARSRALQGTKCVGLGLRRIAKTLVAKKRQADRFAVGTFHIVYGLGVITGAFGFRFLYYK